MVGFVFVACVSNGNFHICSRDKFRIVTMTAAQKEKILRDIREAEDEADEIIEDAEGEAEEIVNEARAEADEIVENARSEAKETREEIVENARAEIEDEKKKILDEGQEAVEDLRATADANHDDAIEFVVDLFKEEVDAQT